jgi:predicted chitinase
MRRNRLAILVAALGTIGLGLAVGLSPMATSDAAETSEQACDYATWSAAATYEEGVTVRYAGELYTALHDNPGYDPKISTWYWKKADLGCAPVQSRVCDFPDWNGDTVYKAGMVVRYTDGKLYRAKRAIPSWEPYESGCAPADDKCEYPDWAQGTDYEAGAIVKFTDGKFYRAEVANPGYDPVVSYWYWEEYPCTAGEPERPETPEKHEDPPTTPPTQENPAGGGDYLSEEQYKQIFPDRDESKYTYAGMINAMKEWDGFGTTGDQTTRKREVAAFLANVDRESGGLRYNEELNEGAWGNYCDGNCPAGQRAYHGRGPLQLSWNYNYEAAGKAIGEPLLTEPDLVKNDPKIGFKTALWFWTKNGPHDAIVGGQGFGMTIDKINGALERRGGPGKEGVGSRVASYKKIAGILGVDPGDKLTC